MKEFGFSQYLNYFNANINGASLKRENNLSNHTAAIKGFLFTNTMSSEMVDPCNNCKATEM